MSTRTYDEILSRIQLLPPEDQLQSYTATFAQASFFLTNDKRLPSLPGLQTLVLNDLMKEVSDDQQ